jgi:cardiolipin synthase
MDCSQNLEHSNSLIQVVASGPDVENDPFYDALITAIYRCEESILIATPYFIPDDSLSKAFTLALHRGVEIEILIPEKSDYFLLDIARGSHLRHIQNAGGKIFLFPKMMHAKLTVLDQKIAIIGSANMDIRSLLYNYELNLFLYSEKDIQALCEWWNKQKKECHEGIAEKPYFTLLFEGIGRILSPLL